MSRTHRTSRQRYLKRSERILAQHRSIKVGDLPSTAVILVDDVMTTGGTLREGMRALEDAGARCIIAVTLFSVEVSHQKVNFFAH